MDNLDFGPGYGLIIFILVFSVISCLFYYLINYLLLVLISVPIKMLLTSVWPKWSNKFLITAIPVLVTSYLVIVWLPWLFFHFFPGSSGLFNNQLSSIIYYPRTPIDGTITFAGLGLTRYAYSGKWAVTGRLNIKRIVVNFFLWVLLMITLSMIFRSIFVYIYFSVRKFYPTLTLSVIYLILMIGVIYLFLKWRNRNQPPVAEHGTSNLE